MPPLHLKYNKHHLSYSTAYLLDTYADLTCISGAGRELSYKAEKSKIIPAKVAQIFLILKKWFAFMAVSAELLLSRSLYYARGFIYLNKLKSTLKETNRYNGRRIFCLFLNQINIRVLQAQWWCLCF